jgi:pimeloyl-ACP methyl ester carboxylesterase
MLKRIVNGRDVWRRAPVIKPALTAVLWTLLAAACGEVSPTPTPTYDSPPPAIPASPTVNPVAPVEEGPQIRDQAADAPGVSNPTLAGLAAEGQPDRDLPTVTPQPTQAQLPMLISASDGLVQRGTFFGPDVRPAPGVLLVHDRGRDRTTWAELAARLQAAGYAVLAVDLRGYGETGGGVNWPLAQDDVRAMLRQLAVLPGINHTQLAVIGAGIGANLGLNACADQVGCAGVVLLSPGLDYRGITAAEAIARMGSRPVLIVASENDDNNPADSITLDGMVAGDHRLVIYPAAGHSTDMFAAEPGLLDLIVEWLRTRFPPPVLHP